MQVKLFGILAEKAGQEIIEVEASNTDQLQEVMSKYIPDIKAYAFGIAVDRRMVNACLELSGNEEVALLPPFAGG